MIKYEHIHTLKVQLQHIDQVQVINGPSGEEIPVEDVYYNPDSSSIVIEVEVPWH